MIAHYMLPKFQPSEGSPTQFFFKMCYISVEVSTRNLLLTSERKFSNDVLPQVTTPTTRKPTISSSASLTMVAQESAAL